MKHCCGRYEAASDFDSVTAYFVPSDRSQSSSSSALTQPAPQATAAGDEAAAEQREAGGQLQQQGGHTAGCTAVKAQLLVASDGYFSRVRRQCLADGPPEVRRPCLRPPAASSSHTYPHISWQVFRQIVDHS